MAVFHKNFSFLKCIFGHFKKLLLKNEEKLINTSLAAPGALANRLQRRTARKANEANLDPPNPKSEITSL